ncbi:uncharacterized protein LOC143416169 isoform X2 [Maylandia zebra]|uniref:uncharacterized protein LOC143412967 isoform X1 n=1 Tax=Maylandia zebra TaxID=106582 RepID=UPI00403D4D86
MARRGLDSPLDFAAGRLDYVVERPAEEGLPEVIRILDDSDTERVSEGEYGIACGSGIRGALHLSSPSIQHFRHSTPRTELTQRDTPPRRQPYPNPMRRMDDQMTNWRVVLCSSYGS